MPTQFSFEHIHPAVMILGGIFLFLMIWVLYYAFGHRIGGISAYKKTPRGRPQRVNFQNAKGLPVSELYTDPITGVMEIKSSRSKHPIFVHKSMIRSPEDLGAFVAADTRQMEINIDADTLGNYAPWTGAESWNTRRSDQLSYERKRNLMQEDQLRRLSEPIDYQKKKEWEQVKDAGDLVSRILGNMKDLTEPKRK